MSYKELQKSLKGPDKFQIFFAKVAKWCAKHKTFWIVFFAAVLCVGLALVGSHFYLSQRGLARHSELVAMEAMYNGADDSKTPERIEMYKGFFEKYDNQPEGWTAALKAVTLLVSHAQYKEAQEILEKVLDKSKKYDFYQFHCSMLLINIYDEMGEYAAAVEVVNNFLKTAPEEMKPRLMFTKGRLLLAQKKTEEANDVFNSIMNDFAASPEADRARMLRGMGGNL